jgi:1-deoxy-D-xylulose-5-phosphate synthase
MSMQVPAGDLLSKINYPSDLKQLSEDELEQVARSCASILLMWYR